jgi:DNA polymerase III delta subunit
VPALDVGGLRKRIDAKRLAPIHVLIGEDVRVVDRLVGAIEATVDEADRPFAVERVHAGDAGGSPIDIASAARVLPMLGDRRIVIVMRAERLLKPKRQARAAEGTEPIGVDEPARDESVDLAPLEDYLESPASSATLVFVAADADRSRRFTKRLFEIAHVTDLGSARDGRGQRAEVRAAALRVLDEEMGGTGQVLDPAARELLVGRAGGDTARLRADVERLRLYTDGQKRVSYDDVLEVVSEASPIEDVWAMVNAIGDRDAARALREVGRRLDRGESPHALLGQLRWWVSARLAEMDPGRVPPAVDALLRTDLALKSSGGEERVLVERLVVELTK